MSRGTRGAYRKEDRIQLPPDLQKELVEKAAARCGSCQELAKKLDIPKSSIHYYRTGRLTMPKSLLGDMLSIAGDEGLVSRIDAGGTVKDRLWGIDQARTIFRETCESRIRAPGEEVLRDDESTRRKAAALVSYVLAEGSVWLQKDAFGEHAVNITFAEHEVDLYEHFRGLCLDVLGYDMGPAQNPGNGARAIRGFIYSRFAAEWFMRNGVSPGEKSSRELHLPRWVMDSTDRDTWISAIQPFCDGEGSVGGRGGTSSYFTLVQSRHTDLDFFVLPRTPKFRGSGRTMTKTELNRTAVHGVPVTGYCSAFARSGLIDDVAVLMRRLQLDPKVSITCLYLKDDGFWSAIWQIALSSTDARRLTRHRIVTQRRKAEALNAHNKN